MMTEQDTPRRQRLYINGQWRDGVGGQSFPVLDPSTNEVLGTVARAAPGDVNDAVAAARRAFESGPWPEMTGAERGEILRKVAALIRERLEPLAELETRDVGKPIIESKNVDIPHAAATFEFYANLAGSIEGETIPVGPGFLDYTVREPIGVIAAITPWNFPFVLAARKLAPALAAGNTLVLKPSQLAPLTTMQYADLFHEAGLPPGVVNLVAGPGSETGEALITHPDVDKIAFTGSTGTGKHITEACCGITRVGLELGGKGPAIVFADADLPAAVKAVMFGAFLNQGETCCSATRLYVEESVRREVTEMLVEGTRAIKVGPPLEESTQMGPMISKDQLEIVEGYIKSGLDQGATLLLGGERPGDPALSRGNYLLPTLLDNAPDDARITREEIFGPVLALYSFRDEDEAVARANDSAYGLSAGVFSNDIKRCHRLARRLRAGTVWVNVFNFVFPEAPYGGYKQSGLGRELGARSIEEYTEVKNVVVDLSPAGFDWYGAP
jgi:acyl-CoA reductase-like NAD-dependent aldehyde dehydrogenase